MFKFRVVCLTTLVLSFSLSANAQTCIVDDWDKKDCGYAGIDSNGCVSKGCCWSPAGQNSQTPWCFYQSDSTEVGYALSSIAATANGFSGKLTKIGAGTSTYGQDLQNLQLDVIFEDINTFHMKITDSTASRWEIPQSVIPRSIASSAPSSTNFEFTYETSPFLFEVKRKSDGVSIFKTDKPFVYKDQYIELSTTTSNSAATFGLGESARQTMPLKSGHTYSMWAADIPALVMDVNLYGSFPFYLQVQDGSAHGAMLLNSNGMDVTLQDTSLTFKTIGGVIDLYVFSGATPAEVVSQYTAVIGRPAMMPYWSLGFHNCKYGYTSVGQVEDVVAKYAAAGIPLDTQWMDIDYMQNYRDFTVDSVSFPQAEVSSFVNTLHANGQHFVPIIDPGIMVLAGYDAYEKGMKEDLFIKDLSGGYYLGQVWPGPTYFPDFLHPKSQSYWTEQVQSFHDLVAIDGIWIDMNEVSNFCNDDGRGQVCVNSASDGCPAAGKSQTDCCLVCSTPDSSNKLDFPPYAINNGQGALSRKTVAASATHYGNVTQYNAHNLYGLTEQMATASALTDVRGKRPFLLTRSSFISSGKHTAKWTGDNAATWEDLKSSIVSIMDFNLFGIPMVGADICGFIYDTTEELCSRWIEVGSFYPFSRNHNTLGAAPQELYLWPNVAESAKKALALRYRLLPFMYTLFADAHFAGTTVARALWMNFPADSNALSVDRQFMLGSAILVSPVLTQGATSVSAYFPQALWYPITASVFGAVPIDASAGGKTVSLSTPLTDINVHVRGGSILPLQEAAMTTTAGRATPFTLLVALCQGGKASGSLFWDDGEQVEISNYLSVSYSAVAAGSTGSLSATLNTITYAPSTLPLVQTVTFLGPDLSCPTSVTLNGVVFSGAATCTSADSSPARASITFTDLNIKLTDNFVIEWN